MPKAVAFWQNYFHWLLPIVGCCLLGCAAYSAFKSHLGSAKHEITCSGGSSVTRRGQLASIFARYAESNGLDVEVVDCAGSEEALKLVDSGKIDVGFVSGGFLKEHHPNVRQLATIGVEPLHLLVKSELITNSPCDLGILKNRRVEVGLPGSGAYAMATEVLAFCGLAAKDAQGKGDYFQVSLGNDKLVSLAGAIRGAEPDVAKALSVELPDAAFLLNSLPSRVVKELVAAGDYDLIPLPFSQSFRINGQQHLGNAQHRIDRRQVTQTVIPASTYRAINSVPLTDCATLGVPLIVVTHAGLSNATANRLIASLYEGPFAHEMPPADLLTSGAEYPLHPVVTPHLQRLKPVAMRDLVDVMQKLLSVFGAFSAGVLAVLGFYRRRKAKSASVYVSEIGEIERMSWSKLSSMEEDQAVEEQTRIKELEAQLVRLKQRIMEDYKVGQFTGEAAFANLMTLISDTRLSLKQANQTVHGSPSLRVIPRRSTSAAASRPSAA